MSEIELVTLANPVSAPASGASEADQTSTAQIDPDETFFALLQGAVDCSPTPKAWHVEERSPGTVQWLWVHNDALHMPEQGWKLHVSATMISAKDVLRRALPVLLAEGVPFKVTATPRQIGVLNSGSGGISQVGKFITIYPQDEVQAVRLAVALDEATVGLRGPAVLSDRPLRPGSLIHYRYGAFSTLGMQDRHGEVYLAIRTPSGELVPDERLSTYSPPEWAVDPFLEAGVAPALAPFNPMVAGRYLLVTLLSETPRGLIYRAVDVLGARRCIAKRARRDGAMGSDGRDAFDRLRNEARILSLLAPDPRFPEVFDTLEWDGDLFLVMEDVMGENLQEHMHALSGRGCSLPVEKLIAWGKELAFMLGDMHEKGLIYRDLKASNVIVAPEGRLRLIDFDVSMELPAERSLYSPGTLGYISRQQNANEAPRVEHDIYSLGALLYFMATGGDPSAFPHPFDLLKRPPQWLNPGLPTKIVAIISKCLQPDPSNRYPTMQAVGNALDSAGPETRGPLEGPYRLPSSDHYLELARRLGDTLCSQATYVSSGEGCYWVNPRYAEIPVVARDLATGSGGPVLALAELVAELGEESHRRCLRDGAQWLASQPPAAANARPGLYNGEAGTAMALLRAGQVLKDDALVEEAVRRGAWVTNLPFVTPGVFNGTAGRIRFHLLLWDATGDEAHLDPAIAAAEHLLETAIEAGVDDDRRPTTDDRRPDISPRSAFRSSTDHDERKADDSSPSRSRMLCWAMPPGDGPHDGRIYTGYALGAAGIGDAFLDLFDVTGDRRFLRAAEGAARWLQSLATPALNDDSGLDWPPVEGEPLNGAFWGHGASGIGIFLLNALKHGLYSHSDRLVERAALTAAQGTRWAGPTLAYGLGGPIGFLLDAYRETSNRAYLQDAQRLAAILETFSVEGDGYLFWPSEDATLFTPDFITGYAGTATLMLRLARPAHIPRVVTLAAARRNRLQAVHRTLTAG